MPYASTNDFAERFGAVELVQLTDRDHDGVTDPGVFDQAASDTDAEIDSYLAVRYALPLSGTTPPVLVRVACDIVRYRLWDDGASEEVAKRYAAAIKFLQALASGAVTIGIDPPPTNNAHADNASAAGPGRVFSQDLLSDY